MEDTVLGYITCRIINIENTPVGIIDLFAVKRSWRGHGIGSRLLDAALSRLSSKTSSVHVATQAQNIAAIRLYERKGFRIIDSEATLHKWLD